VPPRRKRHRAWKGDNRQLLKLALIALYHVRLVTSSNSCQVVSGLQGIYDAECHIDRGLEIGYTVPTQ